MREIDQKIVTVGGGTGSPTVNRALLLGGAKHIDAIAAMYDNGGFTGRRRLLDSSGNEVAYSDALRILKSLIDPEQDNDPRAEVISRWLTYKNGHGEVPGYGLAHNWFSSETGFAQLENDIKTLGINLLGRVIPSSTESAHIKFTTKSGLSYVGEALLDEQETSADMVVSMVLDPNVSAYPHARTALQEASVIFLSSGSLHGSILCNFLPDGMKDAISKSKASVYLVTNLVSNRNENHEFSPRQYISLVEKYIGEGRVNGIIVPEISRHKFETENPQTTLLYSAENSHFLGWENEELYKVEEEGVKVITHKATNVVVVPKSGDYPEKRIIRHDPELLKDALSELI